ncbi:TetR family transcriptional regulator [Mycobacterium sp. SM1]|uniref:TetR/AcrR family transcriptional regulator n=1 Tax=Mycobacterium sp. SM1 TaxID=2816243 RepID=UPI001BCAD853|nr:TetR/AcrR family transcriptional regulator [Mycobacterium sp. SM1]MBS4728593.1 TetR family transcriptional regulator [Mycobacterium sp. SM1]
MSSGTHIRRRGRPRLTEPTPEYLERREAIIAAAIRAFHLHGYDAASLDDVAAELDIRKASLYHYIESKAYLLYLIFDRAISQGLQRLEQISTLPDPRERLAAMITHQVELVAEEPSLFAVFFGNRPRLSSEYEADMLAKERRYARHFIEAVDFAVKEGVITPVDPKYAAHALLGLTSWIYKWFSPEVDDWQEVARNFVRLVLGSDVSVDLSKMTIDAASAK